MVPALLLAAALAAKSAAQLALLVDSTDADAVAAQAGAGIEAPEPLVRATAARVAAVRGITAALPALRSRLASETDPDAAREEVRALILLGEPADVDLAIAATRKLPPGIDDVIARAVARRGDAIDLYLAKLRAMPFRPDADFFTQVLWQRGMLAVAAGSRLLGSGDASGWSALLDSLRKSNVAMDANVLGAALNVSSEAMRVETVWYLVHGYAFDPARIPLRVREVLAAPAEEASLREQFGRELLRRMLGGERKDDPRWLQWLQSEEADALIRSETTLFDFFTDQELAARKNHCDIAKNDCLVPARRGGTKIPSIPVAPPSFEVPDVLPPGLADAVVGEARCGGTWIGTASAAADASGRVRDVSIQRLTMSPACEHALAALMKLSLATPAAVSAPPETHVVLVRAARDTACLDEGPLDTGSSVTRSVGGSVKAPVIKRRVEPHFPAEARRSMGTNRYVMVTLEAVLSKSGCIRSMKVVEQSPYPDLNTAALVAFSQWRFEPGRMDGVPVDVRFNLTIRFLTN